MEGTEVEPLESCQNTLAGLSTEFRKVVERVQQMVRDVRIDSLESGSLIQVQAAERSVDNSALGLRQGTGDREAWEAALAGYEAAWSGVVHELGERRN